jgi:hypothetical protein
VTPEHVMISRRTAEVANYLEPDTARRFREALDGRGDLENVPEPYRGWLVDPQTIPEDVRARYRDRSGNEVTREIPDDM